MSASDVALVALVAALAGAVTAAVHTTAVHIGLAAPDRRTWLTVAVAAGLTGWLGLTWLLADLDVLAQWGSAPPRVVLLPLAVLAAMILLNRRPAFAALVAHLPRWWPVAASSARIIVELVLWAWLSDGLIPRQLTFEGRNVDVIVGLTAPAVAWLITRDRIGPRAVLVWNLLGLASLVNVAVIAVTSVPGPLRASWPGQPLTVIAYWPAVWIPAFLLPLAAVLHVVSIRQTVPLLRGVAPTLKRTS